MPEPKLFGIEEERVPHLRRDNLSTVRRPGKTSVRFVERDMRAKVEHWANLEAGGLGSR